MAVLNLFVAYSAVVFILFVLGIHNYLTSHEENSCEMTYMFEYPQYVRISLPLNDSHEFPRYALYAYGEGQYTEHLRSMKFNGIPVLFIPGNSGSHRQVRSLASVALRKARDSRVPYHFNFFAADLNEEHSALFGGVLQDQTRFISRCIHTILNLYKSSKNPPQSVILIGHSMGGIIAKGVFLDSDFISGSVNTILTLATPHKSPVVSLDYYISNYYTKLESFWEHNESSNTLLVSIGGGHRDLLVRSDLTLSGNISVLSSAIPAVWVSADHLCILWCKQLVLTIIRALFDIVDVKTRQISPDFNIRYNSFNYHLLNRNFGKKLVSAIYPEEVNFNRDAEWREYLTRQFTIDTNNEQRINKNIFVMIKLTETYMKKYELLTMEAIGLEYRDWIFACIADVMHQGVRMCEKGINLSNRTQFIPSLKNRRKVIHLNLHYFKRKGFTHVVAKIKTNKEPIKLHVDVYDSDERIFKLQYQPPWYSQKQEKLIKETVNGALHYTIMLPTYEKPWHTANMYLETQCLKTDHQAVLSLSSSWSKEDSHAFISENLSQHLPIKLHTPRPSMAKDNEVAYISAHLDPACTYTLSVQSSFTATLGQLVKFYVPQFPAYLAAVLLLTLRQQLSSTSQGTICMAFHSALAKGARPYILIPLVKIISLVLKFSPLGKIFPISDLSVLQTQGLDMIIMPILLYSFASFTAYALGLAMWITIAVWGTTANKFILRIISRSLFGGFQWSDWILSAFAKVPCAVACLLVALAYSTCGAIALAGGVCFYFLLVVKMYEDYLEELLKVPLRFLTGNRSRLWGSSESHLSELHFHSTGVLLWAVITGLHIPCAFAWARAFPINARLNPDPSFLPALTLCVCAPILWQRCMPRPHLKHNKELDVILFVLAVLCLLYAPLSLYRLAPLLATSLVFVCAHQLFAKSLISPEELEEKNDEQQEQNSAIENTEQNNSVNEKEKQN